MRQLRKTLVVASVAVVALSGCGAQDKGVLALEYAHSVNLRRADLPGASISTQEEAAPPNNQEQKAARCEGTSTAVLATVRSPTLLLATGRQSEYRSVITVLPTERAAEADLTALRDRGALCAARAERSVNVVCQVLPSPAGAAIRSVGGVSIRRKCSVEHPETNRPKLFVIDTLTFRSRRALISLAAIGYERPVPTADESRLLEALLARTRSPRPQS
jgi:hypothetical protein